jgi:hypothetical protein
MLAPSTKNNLLPDQQQLEMQRMALVEKQEALLNAKKENAGLRQTYDLKIHELRMKVVLILASKMNSLLTAFIHSFGL